MSAVLSDARAGEELTRGREKIIVPHEHNLRQLLAAEPELLGEGAKDVDHLDWATEVCHNPQVRKRVLAELNATGKQAKLRPLEVRLSLFPLVSLPPANREPGPRLLSLSGSG